MSVERQNILVLGGGPAGLSAAYELSRDNNVEIVTPNIKPMDHSVYTTDKALSAETSGLFFPPAYIKCLPSLRILTSNGTDFRVGTMGSKYFVLNYPGMVELVEGELPRKGVLITKLPASECREIQVIDRRDGVLVNIDGGIKEFSKVVDATGWKSKISTPTDQDFLVEYVYGATYPGYFQKQDMTLIYGIAGGMSWASPSILGDDYVDVVFSAYGPRSQFHNFLLGAKPRLAELSKFLSKKEGISLDSAKSENIFSGLIRAQAIKRPSYKNIFSIGEAAGMAKPGTGDSIQRAISSAPLLSDSISNNENPAQFYDKWRGIWRGDDIFMSGMMERLTLQEKNTLGGTADEVAKWLKSGDVDKIVGNIERYLIDGKLSWDLFLRIVRSPKMMGAFGLAAKGMAKSILGTAKLPDHLPLPQIKTRD